jgi:hypothetical protein
MIFATAHFRFAEDLDFDLDVDLLDGDLDFDLDFDAVAGLDWAFTGLSLADRLRLPSTDRPPASIMAA